MPGLKTQKVWCRQFHRVRSRLSALDAAVSSISAAPTYPSASLYKTSRAESANVISLKSGGEPKSPAYGRGQSIYAFTFGMSFVAICFDIVLYILDNSTSVG